MPDTKSEFLRKLLGSASLQDYSYGLDGNALNGLGWYLVQTEPVLWSKPTGEKELITIASIVNEWYVISFQLHLSDAIQDKLERAANLLGEVAAASSKNNTHFSKIREAGKQLIASSTLLD